MLVYFSANHRTIKEKVDDYRSIVTAIQQSGHIIVDGWVEAAYKNTDESKRRDWASICMSATAGIEDADILIAEVTGESGFGVGYEVTSAIKSGKPVLLLAQSGHSWDSYASGLDREVVEYIEYNKDTIERIIRDFLRTPYKVTKL